MQFGRSPQVRPSTNRRAAVRRWGARMVAAIACVLSAQAASAQALGVITGRVVDADKGEPISAVSVTLQGTTNGTLTGDDGRYTLRQVAPGQAKVNFARIGYVSGSATVTVTDGAPATADMSLKAAVLSLQAFVTTVTGPQRKIELGTTTAQINVADKIAELPVNSMGTLLSGRAAGVQVSTSGAPGTGSRIRIRGQNSLSLNNDPLVYVDGIRVTTTGRTNLTTNSTGPSRLEDIAPSEIENIEIIKGPSAATLYGTEAANGVINITTKRGKSGKTVWSVFTENGLVQDPNEGNYPNQYYRWGTVVTRNPDGSIKSTRANTQCRLTQIAANLCTQQDSLGVHNLLNDPVSSFITTGSRSNYGMQVSGGTDRVQFFLSGDTQNETGTYKMPDAEIARLKAERGVTELPRWQTRPNTLDRVNLRANLSAQLAPTANVQLSTAFISSELQRPQNENNSTGLMVAALGGAGGNRYTKDSRGIPLYGGFNVVGDILSYQAQQQLKRFINSLAGRWEVLPWLSARGTVGADIAETNDFFGNLLAEGPIGNSRVGDIQSTRTQAEQYTVDLGTSATWRATSRLTNKLSAGVQYFRTYVSSTTGSGTTLPPGGTTVSGAAQRLASQSTSETITLGTYVEDQISLNDRLFVTGGIRFDDNSAFGANFNGARYPKVSVSWAISEEPWFNAPSLLNSMRVRSAYGAAGAAPGTNDALRYFNATQVTLPGGIIGSAVTLGALGNASLKPETSKEYEGGIDFGMFDGATNLELTYFSKSTTDALIRRDIPPSISGLAQQFSNIGRVKNAGFEFVLNQRLIDRQNLGFAVNVTGSRLRNKLVTLGEGVSPIYTGNRDNQKNITGYPLFGVWQRPITINDRNGDGIIAAPDKTTGDPGDIIVGDTTEFVGSSYPRFEVAVSPTLELFNHKLRFNAQFDSKQGFTKFNNTLRHQCQGGNSCRGLYDPAASLQQQAAAVGIQSYGILTGFMEDGSFTRFRELSAAYELPTSWAHAVRATRLNLILTGRNLAVWTKYSGVDPETTTSNSDDTGNEEYFSTPPLRTFTFRVNFTF